MKRFVPSATANHTFHIRILKAIREAATSGMKERDIIDMTQRLIRERKGEQKQ